MIKLNPLVLQIETKRLENAVRLVETLLLKIEEYNKQLSNVNQKIKKVERFVSEYGLNPKELRTLIKNTDKITEKKIDTK